VYVPGRQSYQNVWGYPRTLAILSSCQWRAIPKEVAPKSTLSRLFRPVDPRRHIGEVSRDLKCREQAQRAARPPPSSIGTFAWLNRHRRLAKDWENLTRKALAFLHSPQSASCSKRFVIPYEATGQTLRMQLELKEVEHVRIEKVEQLFLDIL